MSTMIMAALAIIGFGITTAALAEGEGAGDPYPARTTLQTAQFTTTAADTGTEQYPVSTMSIENDHPVARLYAEMPSAQTR